ncbi:cholesterol 24-hydroxylase-like isoform X1 [Anguilla anguilla]|uniref:cholesterol 24-hydroxylase-like isoform X1 n=1 Tax=Anguilla anguilla TaxID=7936 RepID=UPI0015AE3BC8|nr:cholesterol 24-hydroxylase-like isoform X1 [Anguilla anguilla]
MDLVKNIALRFSPTGWPGFALFVVSAVCVVAFVIFCLYVQYIHMKYDHIPGPPRDSFLFGHILTLLKVMRDDKLVHEKFLEWAETYGPVVRINSLHTVELLVTSPEATKEILMSSKYPKDPHVYKRLFSLFGIRFLGTGLITDPDHDHWYRQRRIMDPAFSNSYLRGLTHIFNERADYLMEKLEEKAESKTPAPMHHMINCVTLDVIAKVAFGLEWNLLDTTQSPFINAISLCLKGMVTYARNPFFELCPWNWKFIKEVKQAAKLLRKTGADCIAERKRAIQNGEEVPKDILTQILKCAAEEKDEDHEQMLDNFVTFFIAGQETTANQIAFTLMELGRSPEIVAKLRKEVDDIIGSKQEIEYEDLGKLTYLSQVLKESLRLYPPAPGTSRRVVEDIVFDGIHIPGNVGIFFSSYVSGRLDRFFSDPLKFDPDRFHPDAEKPYFCYFPFALGPRSCLGQNFSQIEARILMAKLIQRFELKLIPGQSFEIQDTGTLRPRGGVVCTVRSRSHARD